MADEVHGDDVRPVTIDWSLAVAVALTVGAVALALAITGAAAPQVIGDPGVLVRWGLPVVQAGVRLAGALTLGALGLAVMVIPRPEKPKRTESRQRLRAPDAGARPGSFQQHGASSGQADCLGTVGSLAGRLGPARPSDPGLRSANTAPAARTSPDEARSTAPTKEAAASGTVAGGPSPAWRRAMAVGAGAAVAWVLLSVVQIVFQYASLSGLGFTGPGLVAGVQLFVTQISLGRALATSTVIVAIVAVAALVTRSYAGALWTFVGSLAALVPIAATGHAAGAGDHMTAMSASWLHGASVSLWVGGLAGLALTWTRLTDRAAAVRRYSHIAGWCYALVVISGVGAAWVRLSSPADLFTTAYGRVLLAKIVVLGALGVLGFTQRRNVIARLAGPDRAGARAGTGEVIAARPSPAGGAPANTGIQAGHDAAARAGLSPSAAAQQPTVPDAGAHPALREPGALDAAWPEPTAPSAAGTCAASPVSAAAATGVGSGTGTAAGLLRSTAEQPGYATHAGTGGTEVGHRSKQTAALTESLGPDRAGTMLEGRDATPPRPGSPVTQGGLQDVAGDLGTGRTASGTEGAAAPQWRAFLRLAAVELLLMGVAMGLAVGLAASAPPVENLASPSLVEQLTGAPLPPAQVGAWWIGVWRLDLLFGTACAAGIGVYALWVWRLAKRGDHWPALRTVSWMGGMAVMVWALCGAPAAYGHLLFSTHMLLHMTVAMLAPMLLALGAPVTLLLRAVPGRRDGSRGPREWMLSVVHSRWGRFFANPVVAAINFVASMVLFYYTPLFDLALSTHLGHIVMVVHFTLVGYLFTNALIGIDPGPDRPGYPLRLVLLFSTMVFHAFFGLAVISSTTVLGASWFDRLGPVLGVDRLADQAVGGAITWGIGEIPTLVLAVALVIQWTRDDERLARRQDRAAERDGDAELNAYNDMLARLAGTGQASTVAGAAGMAGTADVADGAGAASMADVADMADGAGVADGADVAAGLRGLRGSEPTVE